MRIKNHDELDLVGAINEMITVSITASTGGVVNNFVLNGRSWPGGSFVLDKAVTPVFKLLVMTIYKASSGGSCEITVRGSAGGEVSVHDEVQAPGEVFDAAMYSFTIV